MAVSILAPNHGLEVVVPQGRLKEVNGLVLVNSLGHHKCLLDKLLVFPLPVGKSALKTLRQIHLKKLLQPVEYSLFVGLVLAFESHK